MMTEYAYRALLLGVDMLPSWYPVYLLMTIDRKHELGQREMDWIIGRVQILFLKGNLEDL